MGLELVAGWPRGEASSKVTVHPATWFELKHR
jgi:hypothetical protein